MRFSRIIGTETEYGLYFDPAIATYYLADLDALKKLTCLDNQEVNANFLFNGGRFFKESIAEHDINKKKIKLFTPEYDTPECLSVKDAICWEKAGDKIMSMLFPTKKGFKVARHGRGKDILDADPTSEVASGYHENYSVSKSTMECKGLYFNENGVWTKQLITFLASRIIINGAGWIDITSKYFPYRISSRASLIKQVINSNTQNERAIICDGRMSDTLMPELSMTRIHLILGDHNMSEMSAYLTLGTTSLILWMIEERFIETCPFIAQPIKTLQAFSKNPGLEYRATLENQNPLTGSEQASALELQEYFCNMAKEFVRIYLPNSEYSDIVNYWESVLKRLKENIYSLEGELDWVTKLCLMRRYLKKKGVKFPGVNFDSLDQRMMNDCANLELAYHFIDDEGLYNRLSKAGKIKRLLTDTEIQNAVFNPPQDTRAKIRSDLIRFVEKNRKNILNVEWASLHIALTDSSKSTIIPIYNPFDHHSKIWEDAKIEYEHS